MYRLFHSFLAHPSRQAICLSSLLCKALSVAFGKRQEFLPLMWAHNALQLTKNPLQMRLPQSIVNTLRPRQNGRHFADDIFKWIFLNENVWIPIKISLKFVPQGPINNIPALVQIMAWRHPGDKPLSGPMMVRLPTHIYVTRPQWVKPGHHKRVMPADWGICLLSYPEDSPAATRFGLCSSLQMYWPT